MLNLDRLLLPIVSRLPSWVTPNAITIVRGCMIVPILAVHEERPLVAGWGLYAPAMLLDAVDGPLARHRGITSEHGAMLDATVDKLLLHGILWLAILPQVWLQLAIALSALDLLLTAVRPIKQRFGRSVRANVFGKAKTTVMAFGVGFLLLRTPELAIPGLVCLVLTAALAGASLFVQVVDLVRKPAS